MIVCLIVVLAMLTTFLTAPFILYILYRMDGGKKTLHQFYKGVF